MIVDNLNVNSVGWHPAEANPPLVIDPDAVLPEPVAGQSLEAVAGNRAQIGELRSGMNVVQLPLCRCGDTLEFPAEFASKHLPSFFSPEGPDHNSRILPCGI
jgi:hypothetical protein